MRGRFKPAILREALRLGQPVLLLCAMNELNVNLQHSILTLVGNGWSNRRIARELGINRETVGKYLLLARAKPAISTPGSDPDPDSKPAIPTSGPEPPPDPKPAISTAGSAAGRQSLCLPHATQIEAAVAVGLSAQRIYQGSVTAASLAAIKPLSDSFGICGRRSRSLSSGWRLSREPRLRWILGREHGWWWTANASAPIISGWS